MKYALCYGDSNTWGHPPDGRVRMEYDARWPGVMQKELGDAYHVYENALNGRTTVFQDPIEEGLCGRDGFESTLMIYSPLDVIILALGVNDTKARFSQNPWDIGWGMDLLVQLVKKSGCGRDGGTPKILLCAPAALDSNFGSTLHGTVFTPESIARSKELPEVYRRIAALDGIDCIDWNQHVHTRDGDGVHMYPEQHGILGKVMADKVREICP